MIIWNWDFNFWHQRILSQNSWPQFVNFKVISRKVSQKVGRLMERDISLQKRFCYIFKRQFLITSTINLLNPCHFLLLCWCNKWRNLKYNFHFLKNVFLHTHKSSIPLIKISSQTIKNSRTELMLNCQLRVIPRIRT